MFSLENQPATLTSVTPRTEVHGDERVFAISLGLKITGPNTLLDKLNPTLRHMVYMAKPDEEPELSGFEVSTPLLRCTVVDLLTLKGALEGWTLSIDAHLDPEDPIKIGGCRVDKFRCSPSQGGTVDLMFRIGSNDIDQDEAGWLCSHLSQEITITLTPPEKQPDAIDGTKEAFERDHPQPSAEDLFAAGAGPEEDPGSEGGDPDISGRGSNWPFPKDGDVLSDMERSRLAREAEKPQAGTQEQPAADKRRRGRKEAAPVIQ